MQLLSFDTSSRSLQLSLLQAGSVVAEQEISLDETNRQGVGMLVPAISRLIGQVGWRKSDLSALVVGIGPGSFTAIRVGLVTARTLAQALKRPLIGVSTFESMASQVDRPIGVIFQAKPGFYFVAAYKDDACGQLVEALAPSYLSGQELAASLPNYRWLADQSSQETIVQFVADPRQAQFLDLPTIKNIATAHAQIAWNRLSLTRNSLAGNSWDVCLAERYHWSKVKPLYLRGPSVTIKKHV